MNGEYTARTFCIACGTEFVSRYKNNGKSRHWTKCCSRECAGKLAFRGGPIASRRRRRYGMEPDEYSARLKGQHGACALCRQPQPYDLYVDHDHRTKKNRSLLCARCNNSVGVFDELTWDEVLIFWGYSHFHDEGIQLAQEALSQEWDVPVPVNPTTLAETYIPRTLACCSGLVRGEDGGKRGCTRARMEGSLLCEECYEATGRAAR